MVRKHRSRGGSYRLAYREEGERTVPEREQSGGRENREVGMQQVVRFSKPIEIDGFPIPWRGPPARVCGSGFRSWASLQYIHAFIDIAAHRRIDGLGSKRELITKDEETCWFYYCIFTLHRRLSPLYRLSNIALFPSSCPLFTVRTPFCSRYGVLNGFASVSKQKGVDASGGNRKNHTIRGLEKATGDVLKIDPTLPLLV